MIRKDTRIRLLSMLCILSLCLTGCNEKKVNEDKQSESSKTESTSSESVKDEEIVTKEKELAIEKEAAENISEKATEEKDNDKDITNITVDYSKCFDGLDGCAVFYNSEIEQYEFYNESFCEIQVSPCSTFKIISTLMGLENGVINSVESTMDYDGTTYPIDTWNKDLGLKDAFQASCIWYFRKVIDQVGKDEVQKEIDELQYGNCDINEWEGSTINPLPDLNGFWLESSLKISPKEQVENLAKIFNGETKYSEQNIEILKEIMLIDKIGSVSIYGKTGSGNSNNAWFVGMIEKDTQRYYFAIHLNDENSKVVSGLKAKEIALNIINQYYIN